MPHGWRLPARSGVSPRACATDGPPTLSPAIAAAFVDRTPIDWDALLERVRDPRERASLEALRRLDTLRGRLSPALPPRSRDLRVACLRLLVGVAAVQTGCGLARAAATLWITGSIAPIAPHLLVAAAFASGGLLLASASARDRRVLLLLATFTFAASAFARAIVFETGGPGPAAPGLMFRGVFPEAFVPAALWQFAVLFPAVYRFTRFDMWARRIAATVWILTSTLFVANVAIGYLWHAGPLLLFGRDHPGNLFWHFFVVLSLPAFLAIFIRAFRSGRAERQKAVRFGCALAAGAAPLLLTGVARMASPALDRWMRSVGGLGRLAVDTVVIAALAGMPVLATLAIVVDRPFELPAIVPARLRRWFTGSLRRRRRHERLAAALDRVRLAQGSREVADVVQRELVFGAGARSVSVLDARDFPADSALMAILQESSAPIALSRDAEPFVLLPRRDREWLESRDVTLAAPIRLRDGTVGGVALLGPRRGGGPYARIDTWFISTLLTGAAAAWTAADTMLNADGPASECTGCGLVSDETPQPCGCGDPPSVASLPRRLAGKFVVRRRLGAGGMGVVYLARDTTLDRDVALKTLPALGDGCVARLRDEARAMAALNHRSLATIYGLEVWRRTPVLVVEYFAGGTLADRLTRGSLTRDEVLALGVCLADALTYMHDRGVLHRDLKPANIGVTADGETKLLDFGLSADFGGPAGTAAYLPPEALAGAAPDTAVDLWGLATILRHAGGAECEELAAFFARALARTREDRFQSSGEIRDALRRIRHGVQSDQHR